MPAVIKTIGSSGQITLGKKYAGRHVLVDEVDPGVWTVRVGEFIPANERWLHEGEVAASLGRALEWSAKNPAADTDLEELERRIEGARAMP